MTSYESTTTRLERREVEACALIEDLLPLYLEGEVNPASRDIIVEHLARCEHCAGFLAGAQSVRTQLRRESVQRTSAIISSRPERQAVAKGQWLATGIAVLTSYGIGAIGSALVWDSMRHSDDGKAAVGMIVGLASLSLLAALARSRAPLTLVRMLALLGSCAIGAVGVGMFFASRSDAPGPAVLLGILLGLASLAGVWSAVWHEVAQAVADQHAGPAIRGGLIVFLGCIAIVLVGLPLTILAASILGGAQSVVFAALLLVLGVAMLLKRIRRTG
jgi:hypothetical protein